MPDQKYNELAALEAWKDAMGDALTTIMVLCRRTGLGLEESFELIRKTAHQVGGSCELRLPTRPEDVPNALIEPIPIPHEAYKSAPHLAEHRAARGVKKVRGAK
jgi:hypothetical protein